MAFGFTGSSGGEITVTNPQTLGAGSAFSWFQWVKLTGTLANSQGTDKGGVDLFVYFNNGISFEVPRATTNSFSQIFSTLFVLNEWQFWAGTYDESDGARLFKGTLGEQVSEVSYFSRTTGAGNTSVDSGDLFINNRGSAPSLSMPLEIEMFAWFDRRLSLTELIQQQFAPRPTAGCRFLSHFIHGTGIAIDWSGAGRTGMPSSVTVAQRPDLRMPSEADRFNGVQAVMI